MQALIKTVCYIIVSLLFVFPSFTVLAMHVTKQPHEISSWNSRLPLVVVGPLLQTASWCLLV